MIVHFAFSSDLLGSPSPASANWAHILRSLAFAHGTRGHPGRARFRAHHPPHLAEWRCIHRWEGAWTDPGSPYYGGLQMDLAFQSAYGPRLLRHKGTANHWAPYEQMWVAERALKAGRGFHPWPLTALRCGLI